MRSVQWLTSWGTFISALAAAGGLVVGGVASWAAVEALRDQRADDAEDRARAVADHASHLTAWLDHPNLIDAKSRGAFHVMNRTPDPISEWGVRFAIMSGSVAVGRPRFTVISMHDAVPPCMKLTFDFGDLSMRYRVKNELREMIVVGVQFTDRSGKRWRRTIGAHSPFSSGPRQVLRRGGSRAQLLQAEATCPARRKFLDAIPNGFRSETVLMWGRGLPVAVITQVTGDFGGT